MPNEEYRLILSISAKPVNKISYPERRYLYRHRREEAYLVGENFTASYELTNTGKEAFPGGTLIIEIRWPNGLTQTTPYQLGPLNPGEKRLEHADWDILDAGHALFSARMKLPGGRVTFNPVRVTEKENLAKLYKDETNEILPDVACFSLFSQTKEEYYQYWAMITSAIALFLLVLIEVIFPMVTRISNSS